MAKFLPEQIDLTAHEAMEILAALDEAREALLDAGLFVVQMDVEAAHGILVEKLFPEAEE